jgi:hypothetical protein
MRLQPRDCNSSDGSVIFGALTAVQRLDSRRRINANLLDIYAPPRHCGRGNIFPLFYYAVSILNRTQRAMGYRDICRGLHRAPQNAGICDWQSSCSMIKHSGSREIKRRYSCDTETPFGSDSGLSELVPISRTSALGEQTYTVFVFEYTRVKRARSIVSYRVKSILLSQGCIC